MLANLKYISICLNWCLWLWQPQWWWWWWCRAQCDFPSTHSSYLALPPSSKPHPKTWSMTKYLHHHFSRHPNVNKNTLKPFIFTFRIHGYMETIVRSSKYARPSMNSCFNFINRNVPLPSWQESKLILVPTSTTSGNVLFFKLVYFLA